MITFAFLVLAFLVISDIQEAKAEASEDKE